MAYATEIVENWIPVSARLGTISHKLIDKIGVTGQRNDAEWDVECFEENWILRRLLRSPVFTIISIAIVVVVDATTIH